MVDARKTFLRKMTKIGFLHFTNAPTEDAMRALPDVDGPTNERREKTVVFFHDESTFMSNEDQTTQWGMKGEKMMKPKSKGAGIMVSDFVDEHNGFLALSDSEYETAKATNPHVRKYACEFLEYGESIGQGTNSLHRWKEQSRLRRSNIQRRRGGVMCGCLIIAVAMPLWLMMHWM